MEDLQEEHEMNKYLLQQEKDLRSKLETIKFNMEKSSSQPVFKTKSPQFKEDIPYSSKPANRLKPLEKLENLDDIKRKEKQLQEQLEQLRKLKSQMEEF